jgi:uncharacterized protein
MRTASLGLGVTIGMVLAAVLPLQAEQVSQRPAAAPARSGQAGRAAPNRRLVEAVKSGDRATAITLLGRRIDVNVPEIDGTTALHWAVHHDDVDLVDRLIAAGANVKATNQYGVTPLAEAAVVGNVTVLGKLLNAGADINAANDEGQTALMAVSRTGNVEAAQLLIGRGADVNAAEKWRGQTALMWTAAECLPEMAKVLVEHGADINARSTVNLWERDVTAEPRRKYMPLGGWTPLLFAARQGCLDSATVLVDAGADVNLQDPDLVSPLVTATVNGHYDVAAFLIERGADVNLADRWAAQDSGPPWICTPLPIQADLTSSNRRRSAAPTC